jgi:hypothetical protein
LDETGLNTVGAGEFDREIILFLNELRVALPGVQILFAFMLSVPFSVKFDRISRMDRYAYLVGFVFCAAASILLIAPSVYHRLHRRDEVTRPREMLVSFNRLAVSGAACLAIAMTCTIFVISNLLVGSSAAVLLAALSALGFIWFWFGLPVVRRAKARRRP